MAVGMLMIMVVVHGASIRMYVTVMAVPVRMGGVAMVVRMFMDQVDPEQQFVVRDECRKQSIGRHGVVLGKNNGPLRDIAGDRQIVGCGDDRLPLLVQFIEELDEPDLRAGVETVRGFIEQQHLRIRCQARCDGHLLLLTVREQMRRAVAKVLDAKRLEQALHFVRDLRWGQTELERAEGHLVPDRGREKLHIRVLETRKPPVF